MLSGELPSDGPISVLVGENTRIHSQLLAEALKRDRRVRTVGAVSSSREFLSLASRLTPDVAVLSASLDEDPTRGMSTLREFHRVHPQVPAVMLLDSAKREVVLEAFRSGARGVFSKNESLETLCKCVRSVYAGQVWANSREVRFVLEALCAAPAIRAANSQGLDLLTPREFEVVQCLAQGLTNCEIGGRMGLSKHTVKNYLLRIFDKLGVSNRVELLSLTLTQPNTKTATEGRETPSPLWCHHAANRGVPYAQLLLAEMYSQGKGIPQDLVSAYMWYHVSEITSAEVRSNIRQAKNSLVAQLRPDQIAEAERKAAEWLAQATPHTESTPTTSAGGTRQVSPTVAPPARFAFGD